MIYESGPLKERTKRMKEIFVFHSFSVSCAIIKSQVADFCRNHKRKIHLFPFRSKKKKLHLKPRGIESSSKAGKNQNNNNKNSCQENVLNFFNILFNHLTDGRRKQE